MIRKRLVFLVLFSVPLFAADWREMKSEAMAQRAQKRLAATAKATKTIAVDCAKGESVQDAIDKNSGTIVVEIRGVCVENVRIENQEVTLHGLDAANDGLQSSSSTPALIILDSNISRLENLSLSNNPGQGLQIHDSNVVLVNCVMSNNGSAAGLGASALAATTDSFIDATNLVMANNHRNAVLIQRGAMLFCHGCDFTNNTGFAAVAAHGGLLTLLRSTVTGRLGIRAFTNAYADIDCISEMSAHPCSMMATGRAAQAFDNGIAALYGAGDFTGQVHADDRAVAVLYGARQLAAGQPGQGPTRNFATFFGHIYAYATFEVAPAIQSRILGTDASHFGRILITDETEVAGTIQCFSAGDAWLDPTVVAAPGSSVTGCEHGTF
ncbi:MAG: hypothetical protein ACXWH7_06220 [Thermoanaerobaculia bacterium]